jgi:hypothetical protein
MSDEPDTTTPEIAGIPERVDKLEVVTGDLEERVAALISEAEVALEGVVYRPPLWSQNSAYSAADDRRLIMSALRPGVIDLNDLKIQPRQEGANMSVDVLPGHVVVPGTDQADQGHYVCPLAQRVNVPIPAGPAAGNHRRDYIYARVFEPGGEAPAYWQVECITGPPGPVGQDAPYIHNDPPHPNSAYMLGVIQYTRFDTTQITAPMIFDFRKLARPASTGECIVRQIVLPTWNPAASVNHWGGGGSVVRINTPPPGPVDIEVALDGMVQWGNSGQPGIAEASAWPELWVDQPAGAPGVGGPGGSKLLGALEQGPISLSGGGAYIHWFARRLIVEKVEFTYPDQVWCRALVQNIMQTVGGPMPAYTRGRLTMRMTPSGTALAW